MAKIRATIFILSIAVIIIAIIINTVCVAAGYASFAQVSEGFSESFYTGSVLGFDINRSHYTLLVSKISATDATVKFSTSAEKIVFNIGEEKKFDLNNDSIWDVLLKLDNIERNFADFTIKSIYEKVGSVQEAIDLTPKKADVVPLANISKNNNSSVGETKTSLTSGLIITGIIILAIFIAGVYFLREKIRKNRLYESY
jgi:hypothetical protein